jgi:hypothetical protein
MSIIGGPLDKKRLKDTAGTGDDTTRARFSVQSPAMVRAPVPLVIAGLLAGSWVALIAQRMDAFVESRHHPAIAYGRAPIDTPIAALNERIAAGEATLPFDPQTGYLKATLAALDISPESQVLVYSPTSFQASRITQQNPRAIYFNDTVAVGWIRGADLLEVTAHDPRHGTIFYTLGQSRSEAPQFNRQEQCVSCHLTWDTLGVPGLTVKSTYPRKAPGEFLNGGPVDHRRPMAEHWSGWFVTGAHVPAVHMGNRPLIQPTPLEGAAPALTTVDGQFDAAGYLRKTSDVVALMLLEHQTQAANLMTRLNWETRLGDEARMRVAAEALVDYLLFVGEAPIPERIEGNPAFATAFAARGPRDGKGRSLRDLKLEGRMMRYPLSYMIYTPMFDGLPAPARDLVDARLSDVLSGRNSDPRYAHLSTDDRRSILEILRDTRPDLR